MRYRKSLTISIKSGTSREVFDGGCKPPLLGLVAMRSVLTETWN